MIGSHQKSFGVPSQVKGRTTIATISTQAQILTESTSSCKKDPIRMKKTMEPPNRPTRKLTRATILQEAARQGQRELENKEEQDPNM